MAPLSRHHQPAARAETGRAQAVGRTEKPPVHGQPGHLTDSGARHLSVVPFSADEVMVPQQPYDQPRGDHPCGAVGQLFRRRPRWNFAVTMGGGNQPEVLAGLP